MTRYRMFWACGSDRRARLRSRTKADCGCCCCVYAQESHKARVSDELASSEGGDYRGSESGSANAGLSGLGRLCMCYKSASGM